MGPFFILEGSGCISEDYISTLYATGTVGNTAGGIAAFKWCRGPDSDGAAFEPSTLLFLVPQIKLTGLPNWTWMESF